MHAGDSSKLVAVKHKSYTNGRAAQVPAALAAAMQVEAVEQHIGGKHYEVFIEELLERMGITDFSNLHGAADAGPKVPMIPLSEVALLTHHQDDTRVFILASAPVGLPRGCLPEAVALTEKFGGVVTAGYARDILNSRLGDDWRPAWEGKTHQAIEMSLKTALAVTLVAIKGGPACDWERSRLRDELCKNYRGCSVKEVETIAEFEQWLVATYGDRRRSRYLTPRPRLDECGGTLGRTGSRTQLEAELEASTAALKEKAAEADRLEAERSSLAAQLKRQREKLSLLAKEGKQVDASGAGGAGGGGDGAQAQLQMSAESAAEEKVAAGAAREKALLRKLAEQDAALASMSAAAAIAVCAGLVSGSDMADPAARTAEEAGRLMPSGERAELEREIQELLADDPSLSLDDLLVDMSDEELRRKITELHIAMNDAVPDVC